MNDSLRPENLDISKLGQLAGRPKPADLDQATRMEIKYDGHRIYAYRDADRVRIFARSGREKTGLLREVEKRLSALPEGTWLDGEVCSFTESGNDWGVAQSALGSDSYRPELDGKLTYVVFDLISHGGIDARPLPLRQRRELLEQIVVSWWADAVIVSPQFDASSEAYDEFVTRGFEGAILKDPESRYSSGRRGRGWYKLKAVETIDVVALDAKPGKGKFAGQLGALVFGLYDADGELVEQGACSGMTDAVRAELTAAHNRGELIGTVHEVAHMGRMPTGGLRHPQWKRFRPDKKPHECTIEDQGQSL